MTRPPITTAHLLAQQAALTAADHRAVFERLMETTDPTADLLDGADKDRTEPWPCAMRWTPPTTEETP